MRVTDVRISLRADAKLKAFATVTFEDCLVVRGVKVIQSRDRLWVAMPSRQRADGTFQDVAHPVHAAARGEIEQEVTRRYLQETSRAAGGVAPQPDEAADPE